MGKLRLGGELRLREGKSHLTPTFSTQAAQLCGVGAGDPWEGCEQGLGDLLLKFGMGGRTSGARLEARDLEDADVPSWASPAHGRCYHHALQF